MICLGDSLTEATDIPVGHAWTALVANNLNLNVINRGIGGDTTAGMLARFYPEVITAKPAFVFIMGGTNDLWWGWEVNQILGNLFSMVFQARHHGIAPVIGMPPPVAGTIAGQNEFSPPWDGYTHFEEKMVVFGEKLRGHASESEVPLIDLRQPFLKPDQSTRTELFLPDGLHPNLTGQTIIAKSMGAQFRQSFNF
jgi:lysophospholipase L1-like esterase